MAIVIQETADGSGIIYIGKGKITGRELIDAVELVRSLGEKARHWMFCLHDFSGLDTLECSAADVRTLAREDKRLLAGMLPKGFVVAVVASEDVHFGLARMWQAYAEETGWETAVFRSREDAERWTQERIAATFGVRTPIRWPEQKARSAAQ